MQRSLFSLGRDGVRGRGRADGPTHAQLEFASTATPSDARAPVRFRELRHGGGAGRGPHPGRRPLPPAAPAVGLPGVGPHLRGAGPAPRPPSSATGTTRPPPTPAASATSSSSSYTDRLLGHFLDEMEATGRYDESLIIVTADHGVGLRRRRAAAGRVGGQLPADHVDADVRQAPRPDRGRGRRPATETIDVVPTIADVLGVDIPWDVDGTSMFEPTPPTTGRSA